MNGPVAFKPTLTPEQIAQNEAFLKSLEPKVVIEPSPPWEELTPTQRKLVIDTIIVEFIKPEAVRDLEDAP